MEIALAFLIKYGPALSALGAGIAFAWTIIQFLSVRAREAANREFENFHKLVKELVEPPTPDGSLYVDRQCAILFELRFFPRYYPVIRRTLAGLQVKWNALAGEGKYERLLEEVGITLVYIREHETGFQRLLRGIKPVKY
jgi:hypothetical protein